MRKTLLIFIILFGVFLATGCAEQAEEGAAEEAVEVSPIAEEKPTEEEIPVEEVTPAEEITPTEKETEGETPAEGNELEKYLRMNEQEGKIEFNPPDKMKVGESEILQRILLKTSQKTF
jgi:hypothetical protein